MPYGDPFSFPDPFAAAFSTAGGGRRRQAAYPPLEEEEAQSAIGSLTDMGLSGLGYVGSTLDKLFGGRAIRAGIDTLMGGDSARDMLSILPGSDWAGLTDEAQAVSGDDLLRRGGWDTAGGNWVERNLLGPGVEIALDPSTYLGGIGALTAAGKAARAGKAAAPLAKGFLPGVRAGQRSLHPLVAAARGARAAPPLAMGFRRGVRGGPRSLHPLVAAADRLFPGATDAAMGALDAGGRAVGVANVGLRARSPLLAGAEDLLGEAGKRTKIGFRALFDAPSGPGWSEQVQASNRGVREPARVAAVEAARRDRFGLDQLIQPALDAGADPEQVYRYLTQAGEGVPVTANVGAFGPMLDPAVKQARALYDAMPGAERALGVGSPRLGSLYDLDYMLRKANAAGGGGKGAPTEKAFRVGHASQLRRKDIFDIPGGSVALEDMIRDPAMSGQHRMMTRDMVRDHVLGEHLAGLGAGAGGVPLSPEFMRTLRRKSRGLADYLGTVKDEYIDLPGRVEPTTPFFSRDVAANYLTRATRGADATSAAKGFYDVLKNVAKRGPGDVPATGALRGAGLKGEGALRSALEAVGEDPDVLIAAASGSGVSDEQVLRAALKGYALPAKEAKEATKVMNRFMTPEEIGPLKKLIDSSMNLSKAGLYSIFPASHGRNFLSGVVENSLAGTVSPSAYLDARRLLKGHGIEVGVAGMVGTPAQQRLALLEEMYAKGIVGAPQGEFNTRVGVRDSEVGIGNPALPRKGILEAAKPALDPRSVTDFTGVAGVMDLKGNVRQVDTNPLVRAGRDVGSTVEDNLRASQYLDLRRKGWTPDAARDMVMQTHFDYGGLSDFEKEYARRLSLFYTFPRKNLVKQGARALSEPAKVLTPLRVAGAIDPDEGEYVPEYLRSGLAIPLGSGPDGTQSYMSGLGLPFEEALGRLKVGDGPLDTVAQTGLSSLGMLRPELKGVLEFLTGKQFYTGRDLADLEPGKVASLGGLLDDDTAQPIAQLLSNSPLSRLVTTANRLLDERKHTPAGLAGLLAGQATGVRVSDVDVDKWRAIDARHALDRLLREQEEIKEMTTFYPRPDAKAAGGITPEQEYQLRLNAYMARKAREAADEKRRIGVRLGP